MSQIEQQISVSGSLLSITVFEERLMRNFYIINSKLKKLQSLGDIENKTKIIEKQLKFLTTKVQSMVDKIPKDGNAISKRDVINVCKDQIFDAFNSSQEKLNETQFFKVLQNDIDKLRAEIKVAGKNSQGQGSHGKQLASKPNSFTAGTILLSESKKNVQASQQLLNQVLTKQESKIVNQIMSSDDQMNEFEKVKKDIEILYQTIDNMKISLGKQNFVMKEIGEYERYEIEGNSKSQQKGRKRKSPNKNNANNSPMEGQQQNAQNIVLNQSEKNSKNNYQFSQQLERNQSRNKLETSINGKSQIIVKQDLVARKTMNLQFTQPIKTSNTLVNKDQLSGVFINGPSNQKSNFSSTHQHFNKLGELTKIEYIPENKLLSKAQRSKSLKKLQRVDKKLRVDDIKDINSVLKEIELRLQNKTSQDVFNEFIKEIEEKLQILRITKNQSNQISDLRKMFYNLDSKLQSIITYLQAISTEDDALIVKKNWTCISCDKMIDKFNGKVGQHVNWDSVQAKKISPTKVGAFGQAGQLASKIKNLMDNTGGQ